MRWPQQPEPSLEIARKAGPSPGTPKLQALRPFLLPMPLKLPKDHQLTTSLRSSLYPATLLQFPHILNYRVTHEPRAGLHRPFNLPRHPLNCPYHDSALSYLPLAAFLESTPALNQTFSRTRRMFSQPWLHLELHPSKSSAICRRRQAPFRLSGAFTLLVSTPLHVPSSSPRNTVMLHSASRL